ncbi:cytochrome P450 protein [Rutstroemia sp. NJR-2017a BBW]|nr:cytochrome P450 protein [Rutstroemia sp. NJR-2017a BBW]
MQKIPKGSGIICAVQAADRDEEFPQPSSLSDPETFDIHRGHDLKDVLGFGWGIHRCQAEWLSKAELEIVFETTESKSCCLAEGVEVYATDAEYRDC